VPRHQNRIVEVLAVSGQRYKRFRSIFRHPEVIASRYGSCDPAGRRG